jgi:hypothetical protein
VSSPGLHGSLLLTGTWFLQSKKLQIPGSMRPARPGRPGPRAWGPSNELIQLDRLLGLSVPVVQAIQRISALSAGSSNLRDISAAVGEELVRMATWIRKRKRVVTVVDRWLCQKQKCAVREEKNNKASEPGSPAASPTRYRPSADENEAKKVVTFISFSRWKLHPSRPRRLEFFIPLSPLLPARYGVPFKSEYLLTGT